MSEKKAVYYGEVELIPGVICDGYILDDETTAMSILGVADLLSMRHGALQNIATKSIPKSLEAFWNKDLNIATKTVLVVAQNSHYKGRCVEVYDSNTIESLIRAYAYAFASDKLREAQKHIGKRCVFLMGALVRTALDAAIKEACGFVPKIQETAQKNYIDAIGIIQELGFICSLPNNIAIKQDIVKFLKIPEDTLNSFLYKYRDEIKPIVLKTNEIRSINSKASRMNGYSLDDVVKIVLGMDSETGIEVKKRLFGHIGTFVKTKVKGEIEWRQTLGRVFDGLDLKYNHPIGSYRVDFFIPDFFGFGLCLECNGYCHKFYDLEEEKKREEYISERYALVRFHHKISLEDLVNGILKAKPKEVITLYNIEQLV